MNSNGLFGSTTLEVVIGLVFIYLLLAIICTTVNEWIAAIFQTRSKTLAAAIRKMLGGQAGAGSADTTWFLAQFYRNPLIAGMKNADDPTAHPTYIPARTFATAILDIATPQKPGVITFADLETGINNLPPGDVKQALLALIQNADHKLDQAQQNIENWYNDTMGRVSGWYKRRTQLWTVIVASLLTLAANADTLKIARTLWTDPTLRAEIVAQANQRQDPNQPASKAELRSLDTVIGWTEQDLVPEDERGKAGAWVAWSLQRLLGWALSIVAISLGAPFWFDLLNKFMRIRNAGQSPQEQPKTS